MSERCLPIPSIRTDGGTPVVPPEKLKRHPRELRPGSIGGANQEDPESGEGGSDVQFETAVLECYTQPEVLSRSGSVDWETIFERAGIPEWYRPAWRRYLGGATVRELPAAHYKFIERACHQDPWRTRIRTAIEEQRSVEPLFGVARPRWNSHNELHRKLNHIGWQPVAQCSVSTVCRGATTSSTNYWKVGDRSEKEPGLTRSKRHRTVSHTIVSCDGFRANFQGVHLEENRQFAADCWHYGATQVIHHYDLPADDGCSVMRQLAQTAPRPRVRSSAWHWNRVKGIHNPGAGGPMQRVPQTPEEWRAQLVENYPGQVSLNYDPHNRALLDYTYRRERRSFV
jgi:hypothetical protein